VDLTESYAESIPGEVRARYDVIEVRNAAQILAATNPHEFAEIVRVLRDFELMLTDVTDAGGSKSAVPKRLDGAFREMGWREGRHDTRIISELRIMPYAPAGETRVIVDANEVVNEGYKVDNVKGRVAVDVEWNAKDGNLDRDLSAYRALYDAGIIDGAVIITRTQEMKALAAELGVKKFDTTTTTNIEKLLPRLTRGDAGGCPVLALAVTPRCLRTPGTDDLGV
jgi:Restriction endonuclease BglII